MNANDVKAATRLRMTQTGESYTTARRWVTGEYLPEPSQWTWPKTVVPVDLRPAAPIQPGDWFTMFNFAERHAEAHRHLARLDLDHVRSLCAPDLGLNPEEYNLDVHPLLSVPLRCRLERLADGGTRDEWRIEYVDPDGEFDNAPDDSAWNCLDAVMWNAEDDGEIVDPYAYGMAVTIIETALHAASPEGFRGVLPYGSLNCRPVHRALFGLSEALLSLERYDEALLVLDHHLMIWPDRYVETEMYPLYVRAAQLDGDELDDYE